MQPSVMNIALSAAPHNRFHSPQPLPPLPPEDPSPDHLTATKGPNVEVDNQTPEVIAEQVISERPLSPIPSPDRLSGLLALLAYTFQHGHSARWVPAILTILARGGHADG
jgi:hypothetical protein